MQRSQKQPNILGDLLRDDFHVECLVPDGEARIQTFDHEVGDLFFDFVCVDWTDDLADFRSETADDAFGVERRLTDSTLLDVALLRNLKCILFIQYY